VQIDRREETDGEMQGAAFPEVVRRCRPPEQFAIPAACLTTT
jgi:hypothetical protein